MEWPSAVASARSNLKLISCCPKLHSPFASSTASPAAPIVFRMRLRRGPLPAAPSRESPPLHTTAGPRCDRGGAERRGVHVVQVGRVEVPVALAPRLLVGVHKDYELELCAHEGLEAALGEALELALEDLARRGHDRGSILPDEVARYHRRPLLPGHEPQSVHVRLEDEVPVAPLPGAHRVALNGVHLDVDG